ncbi:hypothetical protein [Shewanella psychrotolerans]|nr:hypothetical protein [Shewanella psychrotolerans]QYJ99972.1 hypothetical protein K0I62_10970 [Shewanella psychrotolerans]
MFAVFIWYDYPLHDEFLARLSSTLNPIHQKQLPPLHGRDNIERAP